MKSGGYSGRGPAMIEKWLVPYALGGRRKGAAGRMVQLLMALMLFAQLGAVTLMPVPAVADDPVSIFLSARLPSNVIIVDHQCVDISRIPSSALDLARSSLKIWYGHTSHGSQITTGMENLVSQYGAAYNFNADGSGGALSYQEVSADLGLEGDLGWRDATRSQLDLPDNDTNVVIWSWCGGVSENTKEGIDVYLNAMNQLEADYPGVAFVYMTGHLDGTGESGNLNVRNNQIRSYCRANNKILFDFADIESYDPSGNYFLNRNATDNCDYVDGNWAQEWCAARPTSGLCRTCECAHSQALNCNLKGRAFWWMLARIAGGAIPPPCGNIGAFLNGAWYLDYNGNGAWNGAVTDRQFSFGNATMKPVTGDWNGNGIAEIGTFLNGTWYLDYNGNGAWNGTPADKQYSFGNAIMKPVTGDWDGNGITGVGTYLNGTWYIDYNGNGVWNGTGGGDRLYTFGNSSMKPVTGNWNGTGGTEIGAYYNGTWYLDYSGNGVWGGVAGGDRLYSFGNASMKPVSGVY